jgi:hypothetical protein
VKFDTQTPSPKCQFCTKQPHILANPEPNFLVHEPDRPRIALSFNLIISTAMHAVTRLVTRPVTTSVKTASAILSVLVVGLVKKAR